MWSRCNRQVLYGSGLRLKKGLNLRVQDIDFSANQIVVRDAKGAKDRFTMLPQCLKEPLQEHLTNVRKIHDQDLKDGYGRVLLPTRALCLQIIHGQLLMDSRPFPTRPVVRAKQQYRSRSMTASYLGTV